MFEAQEVNKDVIKQALKAYLRTFWAQQAFFGGHNIKSSKHGPNVKLFLENRFNTNDLSGMDLSDMDFRFANLEHLKLDGSNISGANFEGASLFSSSCEKVIATRKTNFKNSFLMNTKFTGSQLSQVNFSKALAHFTNFDHCKIDNSNFNEADCFQISFLHAALKHCDFEKTNLTGAKFTHSNLSRLKLRQASLTDSDFRKCTIETKSDYQAAFFKNALNNGVASLSVCALPFCGPAVAYNYPVASTPEYVVTKPTVIFNEASDVQRMQVDNYEYDNQALQQKGAKINPR